MEILNKMKELLSNYRKRSKDKELKRKKTEIDDEFRVVEKFDTLWIMCGNFAVKKFSGNEDCSEVVYELSKMRKCAKEYRKLFTIIEI